ncbi:hypothetical protein D3C76_1080190 [compost metagenome]
METPGRSIGERRGRAAELHLPGQPERHGSLAPALQAHPETDRHRPEHPPHRLVPVRQSPDEPRLRHDRHRLSGHHLPRWRTDQLLRLGLGDRPRCQQLHGVEEPGGGHLDQWPDPRQHPGRHAALCPRARPGAAMELLLDSQLLPAGQLHRVVESLRHTERAGEQ